MFKHFRDYFWKNGKPYGIEAIDPHSFSPTYKIVADPYQKRISIEKYHGIQFERLIYDSYLLDFRKLTLREQNSWERETFKEEIDKTICFLRDQDDRLVFIETLIFEQNQCRLCILKSAHDILISKHCMFYQEKNDPFTGVILYDAEDHPVMIKTYETNAIGEFTHLLKEEWNMQFKKSLT